MAGPVNPSRGSRARMMRKRRDELEEFLPSVTLATSPVQARSGSDQVRVSNAGSCEGYGLVSCSARIRFGGGSAESCTRQDGPQPDPSKGTHRQAEGVKTRRSKQKCRMTEGRGRRGSRRWMLTS